MPVTFCFELDAEPYVSNQIGSLIERLGWERLDGCAYRYPRMTDDTAGEPEDWFNHVVPALMLFRSYVLTKHLPLKAFTLDVQSSTGYRREASIGSPPLRAEYVRLYEPSPAHGERGEAESRGSSEEWALLADWLQGMEFPAGL